MPDRLVTATIDLKQYAQNLGAIRDLVAKDVRVMAVVKANAYGHGIERIAGAAEQAGVDYLGVVSLGELKKLRQFAIKTPTLILNYLDPGSIAEAITLDGSITVMDEVVIKAAAKVANEQNKQVKIHLKIDTGMHRAGCDPEDVVNLAKEILAIPNLELEGVFMHFAESEDIDPDFTKKQLAVFGSCVNRLAEASIHPPLIHAANSAGIVAFPEAHFSMVRAGLITYGLNPFAPEHRQYELVTKNFKPILSLHTQVAYIRKIATGEGVGYNRRWKASRPSTIALLPVGYGDGWRRSPYNAGKVLIDGQYAPIVGSVAMDQTLIDVTHIGKVEVGDGVVLVGSQGEQSIAADDVAKAYGTINYEVVTALSDRIARDYV